MLSGPNVPTTYNAYEDSHKKKILYSGVVSTEPARTYLYKNVCNYSVFVRTILTITAYNINIKFKECLSLHSQPNVSFKEYFKYFLRNKKYKKN